MKWWHGIIFSLLLVIHSGCATIPHIVKTYKNSIVHLHHNRASCSGFYISAHYILTDEHCLNGTPEDITRFDTDSGFNGSAITVATDPVQDIAILYTEQEGKPLPIYDPSIRGPLSLGSELITVGYPYYSPTHELTIEQGLFNGYLEYSFRDGPPCTKLVMVNGLYPGDSGAPIIDVATGTVVGMADIIEFARIIPDENYIRYVGIATPQSVIRQFLVEHRIYTP